MKILTPDSLGYYPDVMVARRREPEDEYLEVEPCLIAEVISPNTESQDRREKLVAYMKIPSLGAYPIVDQAQRRVERYFCDKNGEWRKADLMDEGRFPVPCPPGMELSLAVIYEGL